TRSDPGGDRPVRRRFPRDGEQGTGRLRTTRLVATRREERTHPRSGTDGTQGSLTTKHPVQHTRSPTPCAALGTACFCFTTGRLDVAPAHQQRHSGALPAGSRSLTARRRPPRGTSDTIFLVSGIDIRRRTGRHPRRGAPALLLRGPSPDSPRTPPSGVGPDLIRRESL